MPDFPKDLVTVKFILGTPPLPEKPISSEAVTRSKLMAKVGAEMQEHGDMVMLPVRGFLDNLTTEFRAFYSPQSWSEAESKQCWSLGGC